MGEDDRLAIRPALDPLEADAIAKIRANRDRRHEADAVKAIVHRQLHTTDHQAAAAAQVREQR